jgi:hypothetical protein
MPAVVGGSNSHARKKLKEEEGEASRHGGCTGISQAFIA